MQSNIPRVDWLIYINSSLTWLAYQFHTLILPSLFQYNFCFTLILNSGTIKQVPSELTLGVTFTKFQFNSRYYCTARDQITSCFQMSSQWICISSSSEITSADPFISKIEQSYRLLLCPSSSVRINFCTFFGYLPLEHLPPPSCTPFLLYQLLSVSLNPTREINSP